EFFDDEVLVREEIKIKRERPAEIIDVIELSEDEVEEELFSRLKPKATNSDDHRTRSIRARAMQDPRTAMEILRGIAKDLQKYKLDDLVQMASLRYGRLLKAFPSNSS
ncbi:hypothetical protein FRB90_001636, partial [Tulasnella sp. 427]